MENMKKEIRNRRILAIIAVLVIGFAYYVSGQTEVRRYDNRPDITTVYPDKPMVFEFTDIKDSMIISMFIDRVSNDTNYYKVFVYFPKHKDASKYNITFRFEDKSFKTLNMTYVDAKINYAEYQIDQDGIDRFYWMKTIGVMFDSGADIFKSDIDKDSGLFFHFLHVCNK